MVFAVTMDVDVHAWLVERSGVSPNERPPPPNNVVVVERHSRCLLYTLPPPFSPSVALSLSHLSAVCVYRFI